MVGAERGVLGGSVHVHQAGRRTVRQQPLQAPGVVPLAAEEQGPQVLEGVRGEVDDLVEQGGGEEEDGDPPLLEEGAQPGRGERHLPLHHHQGGAAGQCAPDLEGRRVEGGVRQVGDPVGSRQADVVRVRHQPSDRAVRDHHALGAAGGTGGGDHIRGILLGQDRLVNHLAGTGR